MAKYEDLSGKKFNMLTVVGLSGTEINKQPGWQCNCDCGGEKVITRYHLTKGMVKSCGCLIKYNSERFEKDSRKVHGDFYNYSKADYATSQEYVTITCPIHGDFDQRPAIHLGGSGCQACANIRQGVVRALSVDDFDKQAKLLRNDFTYDLSEYTISTRHINFTCKAHKTTHRQRPSAYLEGLISCKSCRGLINSLETFVIKAKAIHGDIYDYSLVDYTGTKTKVNIICPVGHSFWQTPHNHTAGKHGCPSCGPCGFDANKDSWLYVLSADGMAKIGITNRSAIIRAKAVSKSAGTPFTVSAEFQLDGQFARDTESKLLKVYRSAYVNPEVIFQGSSECFMGLSEDTIKINIIKEIEQNEYR